MDFSDRTTAVRKGEELDVAIVEKFLKDSISGLSGNLKVRQYPGGFSNLTYLLTIGKREFVLRRPPFGTKAKTAHDMGREFRILSALRPVFPYCPEPFIYSDDESVMGCPFYIMEKVVGVILRKDPPNGLVFTPDKFKALCERLIDLQFELHSVDFKKVGLENFGKPEGYVRRQVEGWSMRYKAAITPDAPNCEDIMGWLLDRIPPETNKSAIIHNDFKLDNLVFNQKDPSKIIAILDWEMATIGDPIMDLGSSLAYWVQRDDPPDFQTVRTMPTNIEGALTRKELIRRYEEKSGKPIANFEFYYCFGLFRLAVIAQQIYYRYYHGQTQDERFKMLVFAVHILEKAAKNITEGGSAW